MIAKSLSNHLCMLIIILSVMPFSISYSSNIDDDGSFDYMLEDYSNKYFRQDQGPGAKKKDNNPNKTPDRYVYETPTVKALSHLFWAVNMYKVEDDFAIDEFMRINECDIYKNFSSDEVEWKIVRNATRDFLTENKGDFPTRFEFMLPIKLADYNESKGSIELQDGYRISNLRRFELYASDFVAANKSCTKAHILKLGYPRAIILEFSRPFNLTAIPIKKAAAIAYIKSKARIMQKNYKKRFHSKKLIYRLRNAFLVMKVKIFTHGGMLKQQGRTVVTTKMMGVLEGYEIYEDIGKERLIFSQNYVASRKKGKLNTRLKPQYEILIKRAAGDGVLH